MALSTSKPLSKAPSPNSLTLLFKHHKSTTLLSVVPTQPFPEIKSLLLLALRSRNINSLPSTAGTLIPLPESPEDIEFGVLVDKKDFSKGWTSLDSRNEESTSTVKGKKKEKPVPATDDKPSKPSIGPNTPVGAGLIDGSFVAYRIRTSPITNHQTTTLRRAKRDTEDDEEAYAMVDLDTDIRVDSASDPGWDVILPTFEDEDREDIQADDMIAEGINGR